jgi:hypothetical protein
MSQPNHPEVSSSEAPRRDAAPATAAEPPLPRPEKYTRIRLFLGEDDLRLQGRDSESLQVSIAELLLVTLIVAVILGLLAMVPDGYAPVWAFIGLAVGVLVLTALRPKRAISRLGLWVLFGGIMAMSSQWPRLPHLRLVCSALMLGIILRFAFALPERHGIGKVFLGAIAIFPLFLAMLLVPWAHDWANIPPWLPLVLYLVATAIGAWRLWRPTGRMSPPRSP